MKFIVSISLFIIAMNINAQNYDTCKIQKSEAINAQKIDKNELICIAKNSEKPFTVFYTLTSWCAPCREHFPDILELNKTGKVNLYVVLVESEKDKRIVNAINFIKSKSENIKFGVLKDEFYGTNTGKRNKKFITEIIPKNNEVIDGYGKLILVDKSGKILYITSWKDYDEDSKNYKKMLDNKILPLVK